MKGGWGAIGRFPWIPFARRQVHVACPSYTHDGETWFGGLIGCLCAAQRATDVFCPPKIGVFSKFTGSPAVCERKHLRCCLQRQARQMKLFGCLVS